MITLITPPTADAKPDFRHPHDFSHRSSLRSTPQPHIKRSDDHLHDMSTHHRGLPPPAAMTLPDPIRSGPTAPRDYAAHLPPPPTQAQVPDDSMREWLIAKAEEDRRKQEELKLEQRRIEERMLRDAYQSPVPPPLIPVMFAGLGGTPLATQALELAQQHLNQATQQPPIQLQHGGPLHTSPEARQDGRAVQYVPVQAPLPAGAQAVGGQMLPSQSQHASVYPSPAYQSPKSRNRSLYTQPAQYGPHTVAPRPNNTQGALPRLTTNEPATAAPSSYSHQQEQPSPSPSIFFHHWQPPQHGAGSKDSQKTSPRGVPNQDHTSPPRKRKNTNAHERPPPPPTSNAANMSPSFSVASTGSTKSQRGSQHRPRSRASNYDPIRQEKRRMREEGSSRGSQGSRSSERSRIEDQRSRHVSPEGKKES